MPTDLWNNDSIQFARLIAEMESLGIIANHQEQIQTELKGFSRLLALRTRTCEQSE